MTTDSEIDLKAGRRRVARSRGALSGVLLVVLGIIAALLPFVGPYFNFGYTPAPDDAWHWTAGRFWYELLPGAGAALGGLILLFSASRIVTLFGAWLAAVSGVWLVIGPTLADVLNLDAGSPDPQLRPGLSALAVLLYFCATGAAIVLVAGIALGRLSVHSVRDVRSAERRAEAERVAEQHRVDEEHRIAAQRAEADRAQAQRADAERAAAQRADAERADAQRADAERADAQLADAERADVAPAEAARPAADPAGHDRAQGGEPAPSQRNQGPQGQPDPGPGGWQNQPQPGGGNQIRGEGQGPQQPPSGYPMSPPPPPPAQN